MATACRMSIWVDRLIRSVASLLVVVALAVDARELYAQSPRVEAVIPRMETYAAMSPDGRFIVYSADSAGTLNLYRVEIATRAVRRLTRTDANDGAASWSPDGTRIVFQREDSTGQRDLWEIDADGGNARNLTNTPRFKEQHPRYSADGRLIIFDGNLDEPRLDAADVRQNYEIYTLDRRDGTIARLTEHDGWDMFPAFSPDGRHIVWRKSIVAEPPAFRNAEIFTRDLQTGQERNLSNDPGLDLEPHWSPSGEWIVFASTRAPAANLWIIRPDGTDLRQITGAVPGQLGYRYPSFAPDGKRVVADLVTAGGRAIVIIPLELP